MLRQITDACASQGQTNQPLTETEAAERLGLKVATLRAWRTKGRGPAYVRLGRAIRYLTTDLDEFLHANRHNPGAGQDAPFPTER